VYYRPNGRLNPSVLGAVVAILTLFKREIMRSVWEVSGRWEFLKAKGKRIKLEVAIRDLKPDLDFLFQQPC
jgi:hypothetical protein